MARPSKYTQALADKICDRIAEGESLRTICNSEDMPNKATVLRWLADEQFLAFRDQYARAREAQADKYAEEIIQIADTPIIGVTTKTGDDGKVETTEGDMIQHRRLQVDARKWYASKLAPKKYGDKIQQEVSGADGGPLVVEITRFGSK